MDHDEISGLMRRVQVKDTLKQMASLTLEDRVERWCQVMPHDIIPNSHFAAVSMEAYELYRDGHFYGTISLSQSVAEALARFLCEKNNTEPDEQIYWNNIKKLKQLGTDDSLLKPLESIWQGRNDYHHMNPAVETDRKALEALAKEKLQALQTIERIIFAYTTGEGKINPTYPQYWEMNTADNSMQVYLRID